MIGGAWRVMVVSERDHGWRQTLTGTKSGGGGGEGNER